MALARKDGGGAGSSGYQNQAIADGGSYRNRPPPTEGALVPTVPGISSLEKTLPGPATLVDKELEFLAAREESRQENLDECGKMCMFTMFLIVFTVAMVFDISATSARLADHVRVKFEAGGGVSLQAIRTVPDAYAYLNYVVVPALYENNTDTEIAEGLSTYYHPIDLANRMVGGVRLRQVRVDYTPNCQVGPLFAQYSVSCYPVVAPLTESKQPFGADNQFTYTADEKGTTYNGYLGTYPPNGYMQVLPTKREDALKILAEMQEQKFMGPWTRALFIDFIVWNSNIGTYAVVTINLEFGASGGTGAHIAILTMSTRALKPAGIGTPEDEQAMVFLIFVLIFLIYFVFEEAQELKKAPFAYLQDSWNILDWVNMILLLTTFGIRFFVWAQAGSANIGIKQLTQKDEFESLRGIAVYVEMVKLLNSVNAVIIYCKCVKFLRHTPMTRELINVFWKAMDLLIPFLIMVSIAFTSFAIAYNIGFGSKIFELSTLGSAISFLSRAFLKDVKLMPAYGYMPVFGAILIMLFYIVFFLLGVNVMFGIIADAILSSKWEAKKKKGDKRDLHEGEPVEEMVREVRKRFKRFLKKRAPWLYKVVYRRRRKIVAVKARAKHDNEEEQAELVFAESDDESVDPGDDAPEVPKKEDLMRSIEHMAGRLLSEVSVVGIEIKSELHEVCERVAQMQMAVEELSMRTDAVRMDQEEFLAING